MPLKLWRGLTIGLLILFVLVLLIWVPFSNRVRGAVSSAVRPLIEPLHTLGIFLLRHTPRVVSGDEDAFLSEREALIVDHAAFEEVKHENVELRSALGLRSVGIGHLGEARVVGRFGEDRDEYLIVVAPDGFSAREGAPAFSPSGSLVGVVRTVGDTTLTIRLISSPSETMTVRVFPASIEGVLAGDNNDEATVGLIPENASIHVGDVVITAGQNLAIPAGIPVGDIVEIGRQVSNPFYVVRVKLAAKTTMLEHVLIGP